jgi:hypothetical protein
LIASTAFARALRAYSSAVAEVTQALGARERADGPGAHELHIEPRARGQITPQRSRFAVWS